MDLCYPEDLFDLVDLEGQYYLVDQWVQLHPEDLCYLEDPFDLVDLEDQLHLEGLCYPEDQ